MNYQKYQLVVRRGPQEGQIFPLSGDLLTIGRDPMSDITLTDPEVSRQHARLTLTEDGSYEIQDLGSTNGTFVDGNRLGGEKVRLSPGQVVIVGSNVTLVYESAPDPMATVIAARDELDFGEFSRPAAVEPEPMDEPEPVSMDEPDVVEVDLEPMPEPEPMELPDLEPLTPEPPSWPVMEEAEDMSQAATDRLDEAAEEPPPYDATIIDESYQKPEIPSYQPPQAHEPQPLPSFEAEDPMRTMMDSGRETPPPPPRQQSVPVFEPRATTPPPPPPVEPMKGGGNGGGNRNRNLIIAVVAIILLCCCCALLYAAWIYGDAIIEELSFRPVQQWLAAALA